MYEIILYLWYEEEPGNRVRTVYNDIGFITLAEVAKYLYEHIEDIEINYEVDGEIRIEYNPERKLLINIIKEKSNIIIARNRNIL